MKGYWTGSSYVGLMPDGTWQRFVSDREYREALVEDQDVAE